MATRSLLRQHARLGLSAYAPPSWALPLSNPDTTLSPWHPRSKVRLAMLPTPIERWFLPDVDSRFQISIKRDDLTGAALSGNKVRKLEFLLAQALEEGYDSVITCGGLQSNHCRATALAAAQLGLGCHVVLRSDEQDVTRLSFTGNLALDRIAGAKIYLAAKGPYETTLKPRMLQIISEAQEQNEKCFLIPVGGSTPLGAWGYIDAFRELMDQGLASQFDDVVVTLGSGGTACGLAIGNFLCGSPIKLHGFTVCDDADYFYDHIDTTIKALGLTSIKAQNIIRIVDGYKGRGYALSSPHETQFIAQVASSSGIVLDPVYTGKAALGMCTELQKNAGDFRGNRVLFIHTGGIFGALA